MIEIDGSEAGGQILRTALSLSGITQQPFKLVNIRGKRDKAGIKQQHLNCILAFKDICDAKVKNAFVGSKQLEFFPSKIKAKNLKIDIGTSGSVILVLQSIIPAMLYGEDKFNVEVTGGTDTKWSPCVDYFGHIFCYYLNKIGVRFNFEIVKRGFYPKGGGKVIFQVEPCKDLKRLNLIDRGRFKYLDVWNIASKLLKKAEVVERQLNGFKENFEIFKVRKLNQEYVETLSAGSVFHAHVHYENCKIGASSLGELGKRAEIVGKECADQLRFEIENDAVVDSYAADQLLVYMGLNGSGEIKTSKISDHVKTNSLVIEKFLDVKFGIKDNIIECRKL